MIHSTFRIVVDPIKLAEAFAILLAMAERIRVMSGCIACRVYKDAQEDRSLMLEEIWNNGAFVGIRLLFSSLTLIMLGSAARGAVKVVKSTS